MKRGLTICMGFAVAAAVPAIVFFPVVWADFVFWDDDINLFNNPALSAPFGLSWLFWAFTDWETAFRYKPLNWLAWKVWMGAMGADPWGFHFLSWAFHSFNAGLLFLLTVLLLRRIFPGRDPNSAALFGSALAASLLWSIHPMRSEPVAWITGFPYLLATTFLFLSILFFLSAEQDRVVEGRRLTWSALCFLGSLLSYPLVFLFPASLFCWDLWRHRGPAGWFTGFSSARWFYYLSLGLVSALLLTYNLIGNFRGSQEHDWDAASSPLSDPLRLFKGAYGMSTYLGRWILPENLSPVYFNHHFFELNPWPEMAAIAALGIAVVLCLILAIRHSLLWLAALIAFAGLTIPATGLTVEYITFADRYAYQAHFVFAAALGGGLYTVFGSETGSFSRVRLSLVVAPLVSLLLLSAILSRSQAAVWKDTESLMAYVEPQADPYPFIRSMMLVRRGLAMAAPSTRGEALDMLRKAAEVWPGNDRAWYYRGLLALEQGQYGEAAVSFAMSQQLEFDWVTERLRLGLLLHSGVEIDWAEELNPLRERFGESPEFAALEEEFRALSRPVDRSSSTP